MVPDRQHSKLGSYAASPLKSSLRSGQTFRLSFHIQTSVFDVDLLWLSSFLKSETKQHDPRSAINDSLVIDMLCCFVYFWTEKILHGHD